MQQEGFTKWKALAAGVASLIMALVTAIGPGQGLGELSVAAWLGVGVAVLGSSAVTWYVANVPGAWHAKSVVGGLSAGMTSLIAALADQEITDTETLMAALAVLVGSGMVASAPKPPSSA